MKHRFKFNRDVDAKICEECGYVWGEVPYQECPMTLEEIE